MGKTMVGIGPRAGARQNDMCAVMAPEAAEPSTCFNLGGSCQFAQEPFGNDVGQIDVIGAHRFQADLLIKPWRLAVPKYSSAQGCAQPLDGQSVVFGLTLKTAERMR